MKKLSTLLALALVAGLALASASCSLFQTDEDKILGTWKGSGSTTIDGTTYDFTAITWTFNSNGSFSYFSMVNGSSVSWPAGTYTMDSDTKTINLTIVEHSSPALAYSFDSSGDKLTLNIPSGIGFTVPTTTYTRQ